MSHADRKAKENKAPQEQQQVSASDRELQEIKSRNKKWSKDQDQRPGARAKTSKYTSNKTHYSPTDPDARIAVKPGKARKLNYYSQMAVDTKEHVITHISADYADKKDNQCLEQIIDKLRWRLHNRGLNWEDLLADTGYSSGVNYAYLEGLKIRAYIPPHGTYKGGPEGFVYNKEEDYYLCPNNKKVTFRKIKVEKDRSTNRKRQYYTKRSDCKGCPRKLRCIGKSHEKRIEVTIYREEYERAISRVNSRRGRYMHAKRKSTVEPVFGSLMTHYGMRKVNTRGIAQASKVMLMAASAYNLKKMLKFDVKRRRNVARQVKGFYSLLKRGIWFLLSSCEPTGKLRVETVQKPKKCNSWN